MEKLRNMTSKETDQALARIGKDILAQGQEIRGLVKSPQSIAHLRIVCNNLYNLTDKVVEELDKAEKGETL